MSTEELEEGTVLAMDFDKLQKVAATGEALLPAVVQEADSGEVLIVGYVNRWALETTLKTKRATFWSSSRNELWVKGETSGNALLVEEVRVNCEQNSLLYRVRLEGEGACHTKDAQGCYRFGCFYRKVTEEGSLEFVPS